jgi:hypothetical protein
LSGNTQAGKVRDGGVIEISVRLKVIIVAGISTMDQGLNNSENLNNRGKQDYEMNKESIH